MRGQPENRVGKTGRWVHSINWRKSPTKSSDSWPALDGRLSLVSQYHWPPVCSSQLAFHGQRPGFLYQSVCHLYLWIRPVGRCIPDPGPEIGSPHRQADGAFIFVCLRCANFSRGGGTQVAFLVWRLRGFLPRIHLVVAPLKGSKLEFCQKLAW